MSICTTCPYCGVGCGVLATPDGKGGAKIEGDPDHPANFGRLCSKGSALGETLDLEGRLLAPQIGKRDAGWEEALDLVAGKFFAAIKEHGPDSMAFYVSGQLLTEDYYVANKLMKGFIGSANIDTNSRLCMSSSVAGHKRAFGTDTVPGCYEDLDTADVIVLVGSNLAWCHPVLHQRIMAAKAERDLTIVTVDPRKTATSQMSDMHFQITPDTDLQLFNGLLAYIAENGFVDEDYVAKHVNGFAAAVTAAETSSHECGISEDHLKAFYALWAENEKVVTVYSQGINQSTSGTDKVNAIINCHLATGRIGQIGMGPFSVTGQPNAMGGREVGGLANTLASHLEFGNEDHHRAVSEFWNAPALPHKPGLKAVDLFDACASGQIKALWIMGTNPAVSMPRADHVRDAIKNCDFVVVSDIVKNTDTTQIADVVLPALGWGEKDGTVTNSERRISRQRAFLPASGLAEPDWKIISEVAKRMGFGPAFEYTSSAEIFAEYAALCTVSAKLGTDLDISGLDGISGKEYDRMKPIQWPVSSKRTGGSFFGDGNFYTPSGKANMLALTPRASSNQADHDYPLILNTGRIRDQWHTMTRTGKSQKLSQHIAEPFVEIHPIDAEALGVKAADIVIVDSKHGQLYARALVSDRSAVGNIFAPIHWNDQWASKARVSTLTTSDFDPISGQPDLKRTAVSLKKFEAGWYGFTVSRDEPFAKAAYWAKARCVSGWRTELAGRSAPTDWESYAREIFNAPNADVVLVADKTKGSARIALLEEGRVIAVLFTARQPVGIARGFMASALCEDVGVADILAGKPSAGQPDPGATICSCFNVGVNTILSAIAEQGFTTLDHIGAALNAGTNCGSCRPEIQELLNAAPTTIAAE